MTEQRKKLIRNAVINRDYSVIHYILKHEGLLPARRCWSCPDGKAHLLKLAKQYE